MNNNTIVYWVGGAVVMVALGVLLFAGSMRTAPSTNENTDTATSTATTTATGTPNTSSGTIQIKIALLNTTGQGTGKSRGCDTVVMVNRDVPATSAPLGASLKALFAEPEGDTPDTEYNFIARTKDTLKYDRVTIVNGTANIYLTGSLSGLAGVCDDPRAQIQLEETALQFPTVQKVQLYLNNEPTTLTPSQQ
jgi:hypothetical protein